jgi:hypothetical protein
VTTEIGNIKTVFRIIFCAFWINWKGTVCGMWRDGRFHGKGTYQWVGSSHSYTYSGGFRDGLKHGYGHETSLGGEYKGRYENDERRGNV